MTKQVKVGFDKIPAPLVETFPELVDIQGLPLTDAAGNRLITSEITTLDAYNRKSNAMSVVAGNAGIDEAIPIRERFASESEVSTNLLGVPRAEEQLSLFADVSSYGLDPDNWNFYTVGKGKYPTEWYNRKHPIYGQRKFADFYEETTEQALYLKSFPTQYTFPFGPSYTDGVPTNNFEKYLRFIALGRWLYEVWQETDANGREFAERNFIPPVLKIVDSNKNEVPILKSTWLKVPPNLNGNWLNEPAFYDIEYRSGTNLDNVQLAMDCIEQWTLFYDSIRAGNPVFPLYVLPATPSRVEQSYVFTSSTPESGFYQYIEEYTSPEFTRPGDLEENESIAILESRKTFRYQPGRISGFTFGLRLKNNPASATDKIEWGAANPTDQYMFQVSGTQWNIVRRSTVLPPAELLEGRWGLEPLSQYVSTDEQNQPLAVLPPGNDNSVPMYEVTIPRSKWNGDRLDGTGESGYIIDFTKVTMYKIEYSWYGAIGAKFYAYVPINNAEARWVRLHTMIIENQMNRPVLQNPDFKFRYMVFNKGTANLTEPTYVYKYGASYYIDGGDEGTTTFSSITTEPKSFFERTPIVGIHPKNKIINNTGLDDEGNPYEGNINLKKAYPKTLSVFSNKAARIDLETIKVSPDGQHGTKSISLISGTKFEKNIAFNLIDNFSQVEILPQLGDSLDILDYEAKLIGSGVYNAYVTYNPSTPITTSLLRRSDYELSQGRYKDIVKFSDGQIQTVTTSTQFNARVVNYKSVVGSTIPIEGPRFKIHFLNPNAKDTDQHFADFAIGVTEKRPSWVISDPSYLLFGTDHRVYTDDIPGQGNTYFNIADELYVEYSNRENVYDIKQNAEDGETDLSGGFRFEQDERIRGRELPEGNFSGNYSALAGTLLIKDFAVADIELLANPTPEGGTHRIIFTGEAPSVRDEDADVAQIGLNREASDWVFTNGVDQEEYQGEAKFVGYIRSTVGTPAVSYEDIGEGETYPSIQMRELALFDDYKLSEDPTNPRKFGPFYKYLQFDTTQVYMFVAMRSNAQINNIIVEEIGAEGSDTHIPNFVGTQSDDISSNVQLLAETGVSAVGLPSTFRTTDRLSGIGYDTQSLNPVRNGKVIYSFFVEGGKAEKFNLSNIFDVDRNYISPGLYNNNALYFRATAIDGQSGGEIQLTITTREQ